MSYNDEILWYNYDVSNQKDWKTLINHVQKVCRATLEYDFWQRTCKLTEAEECPVCGDNYYEKNVKCESHHHPRKLSTIIEDILAAHIEDNVLDTKTGLDIVKQVMDLHIFGQVHFINLCEHCHKKFHKQHPDVVDKIDEIFKKRAAKGEELWKSDYQKQIQKEQEKIEDDISDDFITIDSSVTEEEDIEPIQLNDNGEVSINISDLV